MHAVDIDLILIHPPRRGACVPNLNKNWLCFLAPGNQFRLQTHPCIRNRSRANKLRLSMGSRSPICLPNIVRGKGRLILRGRGNRNRTATKLPLQESLIRLCMENPNRILTLPQRGNWVDRESPFTKLLIELGHPTGHSATGKYAKYRHLPKGKSEFFAPPPLHHREIPLSSLPSFRFSVHIIFFFFCVATAPPPTWSCFLPCPLSEISFLESLSNNMHHRTGKSRLPPHYKMGNLSTSCS